MLDKRLERFDSFFDVSTQYPCAFRGALGKVKESNDSINHGLLFFIVRCVVPSWGQARSKHHIKKNNVGIHGLPIHASQDQRSIMECMRRPYSTPPYTPSAIHIHTAS